MNSGRTAVLGDSIYVGNSSNLPCQMALKSDIPSITPYVHPSTKQCNYTYAHPSTIQCSASSRLSSIESKLTQGISSIKYGSYTMPETINWNLTYYNRQVGFNYAIKLGVSPKIVIIMRASAIDSYWGYTGGGYNTYEGNDIIILYPGIAYKTQGIVYGEGSPVFDACKITSTGFIVGGSRIYDDRDRYVYPGYIMSSSGSTYHYIALI